MVKNLQTTPSPARKRGTDQPGFLTTEPNEGRLRRKSAQRRAVAGGASRSDGFRRPDGPISGLSGAASREMRAAARAARPARGLQHSLETRTVSHLFYLFFAGQHS